MLESDPKATACWVGQNKNGEPNQVNLVHKGRRQLANVIYLRQRLRLFLPVNTPPLRLLNEKRREQVDRYLNNPKRLQRKHQDFVDSAKLKEKLKQALA